MSSSHRFLTLDGLMPSTIFDRSDTDMDISEEMEEVRELLYELIKKSFPMGVSSSHLAEKYKEEYVAKGLGRELPEDWLDQVAAAEEFEAQTRGPLTILFVRLSNTTSFKRPPVPLTNVRIISSTKANEDPLLAKKRKNQYPLMHAEQLTHHSGIIGVKSDVSVVAFETSEELYIRASIQEKEFHDLKEDLARFYAEGDADYRVQIYEILSGGAYALRDAGGDWFRILTEDLPHNGVVKCFFVDVGVRGLYPIRDLRLLPDPHHSITRVPPLALQVSLNIQSSSRGVGVDKILKEMLFENDSMENLVPVKIQLTALNDDVPPVAELFTMDGKCIREEVQNRFALGRENSVQNKTPTVSPTPVALLGCLFGGETDIVPLAANQMPASPFPANALFAAGPTDISLRQVSLDPMPDYMYNRLQDECECPDAALKEDPVPNLFYAAMVDCRWERVQCIRASKIDTCSYCVYLIDVGAFHYVRKEYMRSLNAKTPFKKMLMFKCKVFGVVPSAGADVWSRESHEAVREFFEAGMGETVQVSPITNGWSEWKQMNAPAVPVVEARVSCCGRDLADWLISCGLALPKPF